MENSGRSELSRSAHSVGISNVVSRLRATKAGGLSRLFPLLSSLKYSKRPKAEWTREFRGNQGEKDFVMLIFLSYKGWKHRTRSGELESMELTAVQNDLRILLDYLNYRHDDKTRHWYFLNDFDFEYKDWTGITKVLPRTATPTKTNVLRTVREATQKSSSGFIHVGAHCMYGLPGTSQINVGARTTIYTENRKKQTGTRAAYFISSDARRIYGHEFHSCLSDNTEVGREGTLTLSFDMCNAAAFLTDVTDLPYTYTYTNAADSASQTTAVEGGRTRKQLVVFCSSQAGQSSGTLQQQAGLFGAATFLLVRCLHRDQPLSVAEIIQYLNEVCVQRPEKHLRQSPCIASRYPITGPLRLLPHRTAIL